MTKRVANVMFGRGLGGIEQAALDYAEALQIAGYHVHNILLPDAAIKRSFESSGIAYQLLPQIGAWDLWAAFKLRKRLKEWKIDIGIAHGNRALSLLKLAANGQTLVAPLHNYKISVQNADIVFYPTKDLLRYALSQGIVEENTHLVPNMVRVNRPFKKRAFSDPPVIGTMGRMVAKKGFDVFVESLSLLKAKNISFRAALGGSGEEEKALKSLARERGLSDVLSFPGWINDTHHFFSNIDIFCLPSHHEPFGIVLLEAMAEGLPVVASRSEGPSEILTHEINGLLAPKADAAALAGQLAQLISHPDKAAILSKNAYESVRERYDLPVVSKKLALALGAL